MSLGQRVLASNRKAATGRGPGFNVLADPRVIAYFNPNDVGASGVVLTSGTNEVQAWPNKGSQGGNWTRGTNGQVSGQGLGPVWSPNGFNGGPGIAFTIANKTTLKLPIGVQLNVASGRTSWAMFVAASFSGHGSGTSQTNLSVGSSTIDNQLSSLGTSGPDTNLIALSEDNSAGGTSELSVQTGYAASTVYQMTYLIALNGTTLRVNGVASATGLASGPAYTGFTANQVCMGVNSDSYAAINDGNYLGGTLGRVLVVSGPMSATDIATFEAFCNLSP